MSQLEVHREHDDDVAIVAFGGELDYAEIAAAQDEIFAAEAQAPAVLLLDLSELRFMDSSGVRAILQADSRARAQGRRLAVVTGTGPPHRVLSILGLTERLDVVADRAVVQ